MSVVCDSFACCFTVTCNSQIIRRKKQPSLRLLLQILYTNEIEAVFLGVGLVTLVSEWGNEEISA